MKYVKRSVFCASVATAFFLGCPTTECVLWLFRKVWSLYGAYIRIWWEQHAAFFVPLCAICVAVLLIYVVVFLNDPDLSPNCNSIGNLQLNGMFLTSIGSGKDVPVTSPGKEKGLTTEVPSLPPLKKYFERFEQLVNFDTLLPRLYQDDNLKQEEYEKILQETPLGCRIVRLLFITESKGREGVKGLIQSLEQERQHKGHEELAAELKEGYAELFADAAASNRGNKQDGNMVTDSIPNAPRPNTSPKLHLDTVMKMNYSFGCEEDVGHLKKWGLQAFPAGITDIVLFISVCLVGNFKLPPYYELVSPVYYFWSEEEISESLMFEMQHFADPKTPKQASCLSFIHADTSHGPPFSFSLVKGGKFNPGSTTGVISTKPQGMVAIVKRKLGRLSLNTEPQLKYNAHVFYTRDTPREYECTAHFAVGPSCDAWREAIKERYRDAISGHSVPLTFVKSSITIAVPDGGVLVNGWKIISIKSKTISQNDVMGTAIDQLTIPDCQFTIKWAGDEGNSDVIPLDLHYDVPFTGSHQKKAESFFHLHFRCPQGDELKII